MPKKIFFALIVIALLLSACAARQMAYPTEAPALAPGYSEGARSSTSQDNTVKEHLAIQSTTGGQPAPVGQPTENKRIVITDVSLSIAVNDPGKSAENIQKMAQDMGGFVVSINMYQTVLENGAKVPQVSITVRVPAEKLDEALKQIKSETAQPIISENRNSQDVTAEYTDLQSRLSNMEAAEAQLKEIMGSATKTEDVLAVYNQLVSVREQIEVLKGQIKYYDQASALSAISVELLANEAVQPLSIGGWQPAGIAKDAVQALINTLKALVNVAIWLVIYVLPTAICIFGPIALVIWGIITWSKRRKKAKATLVPPTNA